MDIPERGIAHAVKRLFGDDTVVERIEPVAGDRDSSELKEVGYGEPMLVSCRSGQQPRRVVFRTMGENWYGHDRRSDRAQLALLSADTYELFPRHIRCFEVGALSDDGELMPLPPAAEFYLLTTFVEGELYAKDLRAVEKRGRAEQLDLERARALADYLVELHREPVDGPSQLYERAIRDLLGSGEGIFGIVDGYPTDGPVDEARLYEIERRCLRHRFRVRRRAHRLRRTHGDYHPYNILFRQGTDFSLLDASRGGVGDPADDLAALTINYVFSAVVHPSAWAEGMSPLWEEFWKHYLSATGDEEVLEVIAPFFAWRALVVASPVWYPTLDPLQRDALLSFAERVLDAERFDPKVADGVVGRLSSRP